MTIPASKIVNIIPGVISPGDNSNSLTGLFLTKTTLLPANISTSFASLDEVGNLFTLSSVEYQLAQVYFAGYTNSTSYPQQLHIAPFYESGESPASLIGASLANLTLQQLQALKGDLTVNVDGTPLTASNLDFSSVTSFSNAAVYLSTELKGNVTYASTRNAFIITSAKSGEESSVAYATGSLASPLGLTQANGAIISESVTGQTLTILLNTLKEEDVRMCSVMCTWTTSDDENLELAKWATTTQYEVAAIVNDVNQNATTAGTGASFAEKCVAQNLSNVIPVYNNLNLCAMISGWAPSWDVTATNGIANLAFRSSSLLVPNVTSKKISDALDKNGYNYYGTYASATQQFMFVTNGKITGQYKWADQFFAQIYMGRRLQNDLLTVLTTTKRIPYNNDGKGILNAVFTSCIADFLTFGSIQAGITVDASEKIQLAQLGLSDSNITSLLANGSFVSIDITNSFARSDRLSPKIYFIYTSGGSIQQITVNAIEVQ